PPPDERELAPVRLELASPSDRRRVIWQRALVTLERVLELLRHTHERAVHGERDRQLAHLCTVDRERDVACALERFAYRLRPCRRIAVHVAADPAAEAQRRLGSG